MRTSLTWPRYLAPSLLSWLAAALPRGRPGKASRACGASAPCAGWVAGAAARLAQAAVAAPCGQPGDASGALRACGGRGLAGPVSRGGLMSAARRRVCGLARLQGGRGGRLGRRRLGGRQLWIRWDRLQLPGRRLGRDCGFARRCSTRSAGFSPAYRGRRGCGSVIGAEGDVPAWGKPSDSDCLAAMSGRHMVCVAGPCVPCQPSCPPVRPWCAVGGTVWCQGVTGRGPSIGTVAGGMRATRAIQWATARSPGWGSGPLAQGGRWGTLGGAAPSLLR